HGTGVSGFAPTVIITAFAVADTAKVETHRGQTDIVGRTGQRRHHLVILGASILRVRMAYQREATGALLRTTYGRLDRACRAVDQPACRLSLPWPVKRHNAPPRDRRCRSHRRLHRSSPALVVRSR